SRRSARQRLVERTLGAVQQVGQLGDAGIGGIERALTNGDLVEHRVESVDAVLEVVRQEEAARIVERRVHLLAGGELVLDGVDLIGGLLERKEVRENALREGDCRHLNNLPGWF